MYLHNRIILSLILIVSSFLLIQTNDLREIIGVITIVVIIFNFLYKWSIKRGRGTRLPVIYSFSFIVSFLFIIWINITSIQLGSSNSPSLPGDALSYFQIGSELALTDKALIDVSLNYIGYPLVLSWVFSLFGNHLIFGLLVNMLLLFFNIFLISECTYRVTNNLKDFQSSFLLLLLTASFMATGFMLLKDVFIVTSVTISLYASLNLLYKKTAKKNYIILILSVLIMALFRITFIWVPVVIFILITFERRKLIKLLPVVVGLLVLGIYAGSKLSLKKETSIQENIEFAVSNQVISQRLDSGTSSFISALISGYDNWSVVKKFFFIPVTTGIQYVTPFDVYDIQRSIDYPYYFISKNYNILWLIFIGPLVLFSILNFNKKEKRNNTLLLKITYFGILLYILPAFIFGGAIPRYAVPFYPLLLPIMAVNLTKIKTLNLNKKKWYKFMGLYILIFLILLTIYIFFKGTK